MIDRTYEYYAQKVKIRDGHKCRRKLGITDKTCGKSLPIMSVARINPALPDSMHNLETVCKKHLPEWE